MLSVSFEVFSLSFLAFALFITFLFSLKLSYFTERRLKLLKEFYQDKLFEERIVSICSEIEPVMADTIMKQLLLLDNDSHEPIHLHISSSGGVVTAGWTIIDTMQKIKSPVITINVGQCASMGAVILAAGDIRKSMSHARVMLHQVSGTAGGNVQDARVALGEMNRLNSMTISFLAEKCNKSSDEIAEDTNRDFWLSAEEAKNYGIIDDIILPYDKSKIIAKLKEKKG